ncbi:MAG: HRDC domain-containing protein, partial [Oscillospiraceae bacterium]
GLDKLPTYGIMGDVDRPKIREYIDYLVCMGYLQITAGDYPVLRLTEKSGDVLFRNETMTMPVKKLLTAAVAADQKHRSGKASEHTIPTEIEIPEEDLLSALKALRTRLAQEAGVPAYIIFSNAALNDMAAKRPRTMPEFLDVSGVGEIKAGRYGEVFLKAIAEYMQ